MNMNDLLTWPTRTLLILSLLANGSTGPGKAMAKSTNTVDTSIYGMSMQRDWMYDSSSIAMKYEGCVWGYVDDRENMGCMADESEDGTSMWYMMANCRRAQVAYSVYSTTSGSTNCKNGHFQESFITKDGIAEFAYTMGTYGYNAPVSGDDVGDFPLCESDGNGYYYSVGCSSSGQFTIDRFSDQYCNSYYDTYDYLSNFNSAMKNLSKCYSLYNTQKDESPYYSLSSYLIGTSGSCSEAESTYCKTNSFISGAGSYSSVGTRTSALFTSSSGTFANKMKYGLGTTMLLCSVMMFVGILFTNRKKRRSMMHRKFRNAPDKKSKKSKSRSKSKSKSSKKSGGVFA